MHLFLNVHATFEDVSFFNVRIFAINFLGILPFTLSHGLIYLKIGVFPLGTVQNHTWYEFQRGKLFFVFLRKSPS